ncbi:type II toxin-antitoxin system RelE/ParE family toxin [Ciceribacter sp. RN22]|uniref:type II toxin-antitoxin system RelE/ParE family toxin n=1 Tax=Ciceribacter sp. RN22 TaxID=2954932 RepID=UPI0020936F48|nr:type II toxin-antitoxin system RelE/ParE family toxin [Ciceribacter sp. RN22]MCO6179043.1 type II toxin-antitoxin system RelE/ParE family toxin [Ciceribacter sp. RN22]
MKHYQVRLTAEAEADLVNIYRFILERSGSRDVARGYVGRIEVFLTDFATFPMRGTLRHDIRPDLRIVGFERNASVAFVVEADVVVVLRILYHGQMFRADDE